MSFKAAALMAAMAALSSEKSEFATGTPFYVWQDKLKGIDINKEYALIQEKKSSLSRSMRDVVEATYESDHKEKEEKEERELETVQGK